jgi:uncharacterized protein YndB with AHSA1/START domain
MGELKIERTLPVDAETLFEYISQPGNLVKWWGPEGVTLPEHQLDFTKTGPWMSTMMNAEGGKHKVSGYVLKVDAPNSLELTWAWHNEEDKRGHESVVRFEVHSLENGQSKFTLLHNGLADDDSVGNHNAGWTSSLVKLENIAI